VTTPFTVAVWINVWSAPRQAPSRSWCYVLMVPLLSLSLDPFLCLCMSSSRPKCLNCNFSRQKSSRLQAIFNLQIDSVHFVSLDLLLSPASRTSEYVDTTRRLIPKAHPWILKFLHLMLGDMKFSAVKLQPTESIPPTSINLQLHLWGLTLGNPLSPPPRSPTPPHFGPSNTRCSDGLFGSSPAAFLTNVMDLPDLLDA